VFGFEIHAGRPIRDRQAELSGRTLLPVFRQHIRHVNVRGNHGRHIQRGFVDSLLLRYKRLQGEIGIRRGFDLRFGVG